MRRAARELRRGARSARGNCAWTWGVVGRTQPATMGTQGHARHSTHSLSQLTRSVHAPVLSRKSRSASESLLAVSSDCSAGKPPHMPRWERRRAYSVLWALVTASTLRKAGGLIFDCAPAPSGPGWDLASCTALRALYNATAGDAWLVRWTGASGAAARYCDFPGVVCDAAGRVLRWCASPLCLGCIACSSRLTARGTMILSVRCRTARLSERFL